MQLSYDENKKLVQVSATPEELAAAFARWWDDYRDNPDKFMDDEQMSGLDTSVIGMDSVGALVGYMKETSDET